MLTTIIKRLLQGILVVFALMIITFVLLRLIPGDPARSMSAAASDEQLQTLREEMGLLDDIPTQFVKHVKNLARGYMGYSYFQKADVIDVILTSLPPTLLLMGLALGASLVLGLLFGIIAAVFNNTWIDRIISLFSIIFQSMPNYWVAVILIQVLAVSLRLLPSVGYNGFRYAILPAIVLSLPLTAKLTRSVRANLMGSLNQNFVKAAKARGVPGYITLFGYAFRNTLIPFVTLVGMQLGYLVGNCLVVESVFSYPGLGLQIINAILRRDYFLVQGMIVVLSSFFIIVNMFIDIGYLYLDPRIRKAQGGL